MPDAVSAKYDQTVAALVERHGGLERLSLLDRQTIGLVAKLFNEAEMSAADAAVRIGHDINTLAATLPAPVEDTGGMLDLTLLTDLQLEQLDHLQKIGCGEIPNDAVQPEPEPEPVISRRERHAIALARWMEDGRAEAWNFGGLSKCSDAELNHLRGELNDITSPIPCRMIWRDGFMQDAEGMIEDAVRKALAAVGSDAKVVAPTPAEHEPFKQISIHDHPLAPVKNGPGT